MEPIAIVGIGCSFPNAKNPQEFWKLLESGKDTIVEVPPQRWDVDAIYDPKPATPGKTNSRWGGFLEGVDLFDANFFGITPQEAERIDPQQRLTLQVAWEALENAGIVPESLAGSRTGVFLGISYNDYSQILNKNLPTIEKYDNVGNSLSIAANRLSYFLNLRGPSLAIDTACSSSLVAVHYACQSLQYKESNLCLVGGVNLILSPKGTIGCSQAGMLASDGRCKTFDASADGYVRSEGCGVVVLKRLADAVKDGDNIQAIIRGSTTNQDGLTNGLTAPNGPAQQALIRDTLEKAGVKPAEISYVEAHAVGTLMGDAIEFKSLKKVLMEERSLEQTCKIGTVKTNIGHLESASGIASLIKVVLSLQNRQIPGHLHLNKLNPYISLKGTPFSIPTESQPWSCSGSRIAGVSAFGVGGTNCHVILEEAPLAVKSEQLKERPHHILTLSAKCETALQDLAKVYRDFISKNTEISLVDICFTANTGRSHFNHRLAVVAESKVQLQEQLDDFIFGKESGEPLLEPVNGKKSPKIAFFFNREGCEYVGMGRQLYETQPTFRAALDNCDRILRSYLQKPLISVLYPKTEVSCFPDDIVYIQSALFSVEYALVQLWKSWGIKPGVVMGDGVGEYVAACVAGVFQLEDALKLIFHRALLMKNLSQGMNRSNILGDFERVVKEINYSSPQLDLISHITGKVADAEIQTPEYWLNHGLECKSFSADIENLNEKGYQIFLEIGATPSTLLKNDDDWRYKVGTWLTSLCQGKEDDPDPSGEWQQILQTLASLYISGVKVDWSGFDCNYPRQRQNLPTYPFQRQSYWFSSHTPWYSINSSEVVSTQTEKSSDTKKDKITQQEQKNISNPTTESQIEPSGEKHPSSESRKIIFTHTIESIQNWIVNWLAKRMNIKAQSIDPSNSFADYGMDSLTAVDLVKTLEEELQRSLEITIVWNFPTIESLVNYLISDNSGENTSFEGLTDRQFHEDDIELDPSICPGNLKFDWVEQPSAILLTGATGFVGAFLLDELLNQTQADIYCLVRSSNVDSAMMRLQNTLEHYGIWNHNFRSRIIPIVGDISKFQLGLGEQQFQELSNKIDIVYHSAALVNYVYPYSRCRPHNVLGTQEILRFASHNKIKLVNHISTGGVFGSAKYYGKVVTESNQLARKDGIHFGYSQSKWTAEKLVMTAGDRGLPVCIYRPQFISGHSQTGAVNANDLLITLLIKSFIEIGMFPELDYEVNISPVDFVTKAIVHLSKQKQSLGKAFHLHNNKPIHWNQLSNWIKAFGYQFEGVSYESLLEKIHQVVDSSNSTLYPLLPFIAEKRSEDKLTILQLYQKAIRPKISCEETLSALANTSIACPEIDDKLLNNYFSYLISSGFLNAPPGLNHRGSLPVIAAKNTDTVVEKTPWLQFPKTNTQAQVRLFCFHNGGGDASLFFSWSDILSPKIEVCSVQLPGRTNRISETPLTSVRAIVENLTKVLHPYLKVPFAFFGHSMGATISFELARELRKQYGLSPLHLFVSAAQAPHIPEPLPLIPSLNATDDEIIESMGWMDSIPERFLQNTKFMENKLPTIRADLEVVQTYTYSEDEPLNCPISVFGGSEDPLVSQERLLAWKKQTSNSFAIQMFPGDHFFLRKQQDILLQGIFKEITTANTVNKLLPI